MVATLFCVSSINKCMKDIYEYITTPKAERQKHLKLDEECVERGAGSYYFKGLLAHLLDTTVPTGHKVHLCHACHNDKCSNPKHLYWGTRKENVDIAGIMLQCSVQQLTFK